MKNKFIVLLFVGLVVALNINAAEKAEIDKPAPGFTLVDVEGNEHSLNDYEGKFVVLEWVNFDCPFVRKHYEGKNMQKLQKEYTEEGVVWLSICSSAEGTQGYYDTAEIKKRIKNHDAAMSAYLIDESGKVGRMFGAKTTPHMYVINPEGVLVYAGGIDDRPSTSKADLVGATNYVSEALDAAMNGKEIKTKVSRPYGCSVKYKN